MAELPVESPDRWIALFLMTAVYAMNIADRFVISTLIEPIKAEFSLSDGAVGFLTGTALAIFYVAAGIPLGVLADRTNRKKMTALALAGWSLFTIACGYAQGFWHLFFARIGVGVGEAGGTPPSQALLSDKFLPSKRAFAMSIFGIGAAVGAWIGSTGGGWINDHHGWRAVFVAFGIAGLPLAAIVWLGVREPRRGQLDPSHAAVGTSSLGDTLRFVRTQKALLHILAGATVITFWGWGLIWWTPSFLVRSHHLSVGEAGALLGPMHGIGGAAAILLTAWVMHWSAGRDARWQIWVVAVTALAGTGASAAAYLTESRFVAEIMLWVFVPIAYVYIGPTLALVQNAVLPSMRAQIIAILLFVANIANLAVAPQVIGWASDWLETRVADPQQSLRYVLVAGTLTGLWAVFHYLAAARYLHADLLKAGTELAVRRTGATS
ncbi:spinster family MFS transporter [Azospirillum sp. CT11-132]|uniref:spinster family MFS transporter n=1 Tax=Azospirillum sp. CT11-132 TaxID=3396317 RepID=UPI0039A65C07